VSDVPPDTKDWTWVLERPCPQCGVDAGSLEPGELPRLLRDNAQGWLEVLATDGVASRRDATTWSPLEYACHVRDVHRVFDERLALMLERSDPAFADWDQNHAALDGHYADAVPRKVGDELAATAERVAARYAQVGGDRWSRTGRRSDGWVFTVASLGRYHAHDVLHHLWDVRG
jgi:hypothetical protein